MLPVVSSTAFRALQQCEMFDDGSEALKADYRMDCKSEAYGDLQRLAQLTLFVYVGLVPVFYYLLLKRAAPAILSGRYTGLSKALAFFHADYEPEWYYWEILETCKKARLSLRSSSRRSCALGAPQATVGFAAGGSL